MRKRLEAPTRDKPLDAIALVRGREAQAIEQECPPALADAFLAAQQRPPRR